MNNVHFSSKSNEWSTPQDFFDSLNKEFKFTLDPCCTKETAKCKKFYTEKEDGLAQNWNNEIVFCNPPYGRELKKWVKKSFEATGGGSRDVDSGSNRYNIFSRFYLSRSNRDTVFAWPIKIWRQQKFSTISINGCCV
jgi:site-specific DNA-methyltransferase (adenine-specific)